MNDARQSILLLVLLGAAVVPILFAANWVGHVLFDALRGHGPHEHAVSSPNASRATESGASVAGAPSHYDHTP